MIDKKTIIELDPQCLKDEMQVAITNKGELIPCCYLDTQRNNLDPEYRKLLKVSKISDVNSIEEIYLTKEWQEFADNLRNHKGPYGCRITCPKKRDIDNVVRKEKIYHKGSKTYEKNY
jgi:hypothetical protein